MSLSGSPPPARKSRATPSLKMQATGFLSRREHSRQELRAKLLAAIRKREREEAALAAAAAAHAEDVARALRETPTNGIDDAFAPRGAGKDVDDGRAPRRASQPVDEARAPAPRANLRFADGRAAPASLLAATPGLARTAAGRPVSSKDPHPDPSDLPGADPDGLAGEKLDPEARVDQLLDWLEAHGYLSDTRFVESRVHARAARQGATRIRHELERHGLALEPEQAAALRESEFARAQAIWQRKFGVVGADARERARQARFLAARGFAADVVRRIVGGEDDL